MPSRVLTVMFTDIKGFTERTSQSSRIELRKMIAEHESLLRPVVEGFGGRVVKTVGDAFMVVFESPTNAVHSGVMIQERLRERNQSLPRERHLEVRVAINVGEVVEREGDVFGEAVNIASRIEGITEAGEIYFTEGVYLSMNKAEVPSSEVGHRRLKGIPEAIRVYSVIRDPNSERYRHLVEELRAGRFDDVALPSTGERPPVRSRVPAWVVPLAAGGALAVAVAVAAALVLSRPARETGEGAAAPEKTDAPPPAAVPTPAPAADPVAEAAREVERTVAAGELGLALAQADKMLKDFPGRRESHEAVRAVVRAEVAALVGRERFAEAIDLLDERAKAREYVSFKETRRELLLGYARQMADRGSTGFADRAYAELLRENPEDVEVLRDCVARLGGTAEGRSPTGAAERAAMKLAGLGDGAKDALPDPVGWTLLGSLRYRGPRHEEAVEKRGLLIERWPGVEAGARKELASDRRDARLNAYLMLKERGGPSPDEELVYHLKNLTSLSYGGPEDREAVDAALGHVEAAAKEPGWEARLARTGVERIDKVPAFWHADAPYDRIAAALTGPLVSISRESILKWASSDEHSSHRQRAFKMLPAVGLADRVDPWEFHKRGLLLDGYEYRYPWLHDAISYFKGEAGGARAAEARKLLEDALARMEKELASLERPKKREFGANYEANVEALKAALAAFE